MKTPHLRRCRLVPLPAAYPTYASVGDSSAPSIWGVLIALIFSTLFEWFAGLSKRLAHSRFARGRGATFNYLAFFGWFAGLSKGCAHSRFARGRGATFTICYCSRVVLGARCARRDWPIVLVAV